MSAQDSERNAAFTRQHSGTTTSLPVKADVPGNGAEFRQISNGNSEKL